jgi:hypothetical protein
MTCKYNDKPVKRPTTVKRERSNSLPSLETLISTDNLYKISNNELYETFRSTSKNRRQYGTPTLLFEFYSYSLHTASVWTWFIECFNRFCNYPQQQSLQHQLAKEAFRLFVTHNLLYGAFIHTQLVLENALSLSLEPKHSPKPASLESPDSMLVHIILALTFQTAYQTLVNDTASDHLCTYAHRHYRQAHQQFMEACFPYESTEMSFNRKKSLVQASVLIAHFQCQVIDQEQAYMTIRMGLSLAQQFGLYDIKEDDSLDALLKVLDAWHIWLTFYLAKPYLSNELNSASAPCYAKEQQWALQVTDAYTSLLKTILKKKRSGQSINLSTITVSTCHRINPHS